MQGKQVVVSVNTCVSVCERAIRCVCGVCVFGNVFNTFQVICITLVSPQGGVDIQ